MTLAVSTYAVDKRTTWKNSGLNGIRAHDFCDSGAALSPNPVDSKFNESEYMK